jgi:RNA polymerase sigma-70 factor, ECF subfamily
VPTPDELLPRARSGDRAALDLLLGHERPRILRMIGCRLDPRLRARVDASDVVQDCFAEAAQRLPEYFASEPMPFVIWLRFLAAQRLMALQRTHFGTQARDARREIALGAGALPAPDCSSIAGSLFDEHTSPTGAAAREELRTRVEQALASMDETDREILVLRHFEELTNEEAARELGIETAAASKRFVRALQRLRGVLEGTDGDRRDDSTVR